MIKVAEKAKDEVTKLMKHDGFDPSVHILLELVSRVEDAQDFHMN